MPSFASRFPAPVLAGLLCLASIVGCGTGGDDEAAAGLSSENAAGRDGSARAGSGGATARTVATPGSGGKVGSMPSKSAAGLGKDDRNLLPSYASSEDPGFCTPSLVVMLPLSNEDSKASFSKVKIHADTTGGGLVPARNRYRASCGSSEGEDLLVGLSVPASGRLTLSLAAVSEGFEGVLSVERGVCTGEAAPSASCAVADAAGIAALSLDVVEGEQLFVFVDTPKGSGGELDLVATLVPAR